MKIITHIKNNSGNKINSLFSNIGIPVITSRLILILIGYSSLFILPNSEYPFNSSGFGWTNFRFLDIWARWDTGWYYSIVTNGYTQNFDFLNTQSNIAFFPLYPFLIKASNLFVIDFSNKGTLFLLFALLVSNVSFVLSLIFLYEIIKLENNNFSSNSNAIWLLILYPYSFFFSTAYTESTFLLFMVMTFYFCIKSKWRLAAITGVLLSLSRPLGVLVILPIMIRYVICKKWKFSKLDLLFFILIPISFGIFLIYGYTLTGSFLAPLKIQSTWGSEFRWPWQTIFDPNTWNSYITNFDLFFAIFSLLNLGLYIVKKFRYFEWALYSILIVLIPLFSGHIRSSGRYSIIAFPMYLLLDNIIRKNEELKIPIYIFFAMIQALLFVGWCRGYFVG